MAKTSKGGRAAAERLKNDLLAAKEWLNSAKNDGQVLTNTAPANRWEQLTFEQRLALADAIRQRRRLASKLGGRRGASRFGPPRGTASLSRRGGLRSTSRSAGGGGLLLAAR